MFFFGDDSKSKRTLGIRDKQILYRNAKARCENPACGKKIDFDEMEIGHKTAWSKGGRTTLKTCVCLCHRCNKLQGTDSWATFLKKQGIEDSKMKMKKSLETLNMRQLKFLADKHNIKVKGQVVEGFFSSHIKAPAKRQYITKLAGEVTEKELNSMRRETPKNLS